MADDVLRDEEVQKPEGEPLPDTPKKEKSGNFIALIGIVVMVTLMSFLAYFVSQMIVSEPIGPKTPAADEIISNLNEDKIEKPENTTEESSSEPVKYVVEIKDMVINPKNSNGEHFLSLNVGIGFSSPDLQKEVDASKIQIKDRIIFIMSSIPYEIMADIRYRESIKKQLIKGINEILTSGKIQNVYFTEFVLQ